MRKGERTRERVLAIAEGLILQRGFSGTSIDDIIDAADITKGGFFYHFRGKADLARALVLRYLDADELFFRRLVDRAEELVEDPLQRVLLFLKLFAEAMADIPGTHPGCLVASFTYESQLLDPELRSLMAEGVQSWRRLFVSLFEPVVEKYPMREEVALDDLADMLTSIIEGGIIVSRINDDPRALVQQLLQYRSHVRMLFGDLG